MSRCGHAVPLNFVFKLELLCIAPGACSQSVRKSDGWHRRCLQLFTNLIRARLFIHRYNAITVFQRFIAFLLLFVLKIDEAAGTYPNNHKFEIRLLQQSQCEAQMWVLYSRRVPPIEEGRRHAKRLCSRIKNREAEGSTGEIGKLESNKLREKLVSWMYSAVQ